MARQRGVYGLAASGGDPGTFGLEAAEETQKLSDAFAELLKVEQLEMDAAKLQADLLQKQVDLEARRRKELQATADVLHATSDAIREAGRAGQEAGAGLRGWAGVLASLLRFDFLGAVQGLAGLAGRGAATAANSLAARATPPPAGPSLPPAPPVLPPTLPRPAATAASGAAPRPAAVTPSPGPGVAAAAGAAGLEGLAGAAAAAAGPVAAVAAALKEFADLTVSLAGKASPVELERFNMALDDAQAVLGRVFVPVLELMTDGVRLLGDVLASVLPSTDEVRKALEPLKDALDVVREAAGNLAPVLRTWYSLLVNVAGVLAKVAYYTSPLLLLLRAVNAVFEALGLTSKLASSVGAAPRQASFTDLESYAKSSYAKAASVGRDGKPERTVLEKILDEVKRIADFVTGTRDAVSKGGDVVALVSALFNNPVGFLHEISRRGIRGA